jgi:THO complex subunit 2
LVPALSLVGSNPGVINEVYALIQNFPYSRRFSLYGEWQTTAYKTYPELKLKASEADKETKGILRRISKEDVKRFGRALAKISTSNPLVLWTIAINQIENYENFVEVVVDAAKFCTNLGYDVLVFIILSSLANPFKTRVKEDGTSIAVWLTGLSAFCAKLYRRYTYMDVGTAASYVSCQLKRGNIYDLIVLSDLVTQMAGILVSKNLSDHQLRCYAGGEVLKEQAISPLRESGNVIGLKKSSARLLKGLMDRELTAPLLLLIAQERSAALFNLKIENGSNLKLLGNLFDEVRYPCLRFWLTFLSVIVFWSNFMSLSYQTLIYQHSKRFCRVFER